MKKFISILFTLGLLLILCGPSSAATVCYADGKLCINTTTGEISLDGVIFYTKGADGYNRIVVGNNTARSPAASTMELYPEANIWKANQDGTEYSLVIGPTGGQVTFTGPTAARSYVLPDANATITRTIASGSDALDFASTATGACATVISVAATGVATTDVIIFTPNASIKGVTGYVPASTGGFSITAYPTDGYVNFEACNWTAGTVDPGSITVNWKVIR